MTMILLIDLDDTLLINDMDVFIPSYLQKLGAHMAEVHDPKVLIQQLLTATQSMLTNTDPSTTLKENFDRDFYPVLGIDYESTTAHIETFYKDRFPDLISCTQFVPSAKELVSKSLSDNLKVIVATNPLFPRTAITQRIEWAGLGDFIDDFELITSYEEYHFTKPNPAYYAEILARLGWPDEPIIMVGNDKELDIEAANKLGIATFWVNPDTNITHQNIMDGQPISAEGNLSEVFDFIKNSSKDHFKAQYKSTDSIIAILLSTPAALGSMLKDKYLNNVNENRINENWGIREILCHLRDVDLNINLPRIKMLLETENPFISSIEADAWAIDCEYHKQDPVKALDEFIEARKQILSLISEFDQETWQKSARHSIFGPTNMKELLQLSARHDRLHIQQIFPLLN